MKKLIAILPGDGIGKEIINQAIKIIDYFIAKGLNVEYTLGYLGGSAYDKYNDPYPEETKSLCLKKADAVLLGAVGGIKYDNLERKLRPERGLLAIRQDLQVFANLRHVFLYPQLSNASSLKSNIINKLDLLIIRELIGGIYFGNPRGIINTASGEREGFNTMRYSESQIKRIGHIAYQVANKRNKKLCSVDKANVLETSELWRDVMINLNKEYPQVKLTHMYVDNAAMQLVKDPNQFDVIVTSNLFGDILSDLAAMLTGSIGMLPSASLNKDNKGIYEPIHGSAPDIAGKDLANPIATILSLSMLFKYSLNFEEISIKIENAINNVLQQGFRTKDIFQEENILLSCSQMGDKILEALDV